jgi:hypothetical protein
MPSTVNSRSSLRASPGGTVAGQASARYAVAAAFLETLSTSLLITIGGQRRSKTARSRDTQNAADRLRGNSAIEFGRQRARDDAQALAAIDSLTTVGKQFRPSNTDHEETVRPPVEDVSGPERPAKFKSSDVRNDPPSVSVLPRP